MKLIDGHDVIEHAEVNGESREFIRKLTDYIEDADVVEPKTGDLISRKALLKQIDIDSEGRSGWYGDTWRFIDTINNMPSYEPTIEIDADQLAKLLREGWTIHSEPKWIPCSERLPEDLETVNVTWVNHRPQSYYADIKDKPFTATAIHHRDKWWWYSPICEDLLAEYGKSECDKMDADIEVTAWMPLPKPWEGADDEGVR